MVEVGQVYYYKKADSSFVITFTDEDGCAWITDEGKVGVDTKYWVEKYCELKAQYPTWLEAVNSKEFNQ